MRKEKKSLNILLAVHMIMRAVIRAIKTDLLMLLLLIITANTLLHIRGPGSTFLNGF